MAKKRSEQKSGKQSTGDVADYLDEEIVSFKDLGKKDRSWSRLAVNLICFVLFLTASLF